MGASEAAGMSGGAHGGEDTTRSKTRFTGVLRGMRALRLCLVVAVISISSAETACSTNTGACCPPDPMPACCMDYGGWSSSGLCGAKTCDGMPAPNDPGWKLIDDSHGCRMWFHPLDGGRSANCCGCAGDMSASPS